MKKKTKKIKIDLVELLVLENIIKTLGWKGAVMKFPYYNSKGLLRTADVTFKVKWNVKK